MEANIKTVGSYWHVQLLILTYIKTVDRTWHNNKYKWSNLRSHYSLHVLWHYYFATYNLLFSSIMHDRSKKQSVCEKKNTIIQTISIIVCFITIIEIGTCIQDLQIAITSCYHVLCHWNISDTKYKLLYSFRIHVFMHLCNCYLILWFAILVAFNQRLLSWFRGWAPMKFK